MNDKFLTLLGFATKAGRLSFGMNACISAVCSKKSQLVLVCRDISEKSKKEIAFHCSKNSIGIIVLDDYDIMTVSNAVGRKCGMISINDGSFAEAVNNTLGGNA